MISQLLKTSLPISIISCLLVSGLPLPILAQEAPLKPVSPENLGDFDPPSSNLEPINPENFGNNGSSFSDFNSNFNSDFNSSSPSETDYTLGAGDRIRVDIFQVEEYSGEYRVLVDGTVSLPLAGRVSANNLTITEFTNIVSQRYGQYLRRPLVTVTVIEPRPLSIAIAGEVNNPGAYTVNLEQKFPSVTDLIQLAGGITTTANIREVEIKRTISNREQVMVVNLWELIQNGNINKNISLRDGDTIFIPTVDEIDVAQVRQLAAANFGLQIDKTINVAVIGEISRPGTYEVNPNESENEKQQLPRLTQAIALAGGIKPLANIRKIEVRRLTRTGEQKKIEVDLWQLLETGNIDEDIILAEGDTIFIPTAEEIRKEEVETLASASFSPDTITVNIVGEVRNPGSLEVPPNTPLNQAILAAGGFDKSRAEENNVELIRLNPNGTVETKLIQVNFADGIDESVNPVLRNNDVVVINRTSLARTTDALGTAFSPLGGLFSIFRIFDIVF